MKNIISKISMVTMVFFININNSYAAPACYMQMRSLNLSVAKENKKVCEQKKITAEPIQINTKETEESTVEVEAYFVYPHTENTEEEATADGVGANISIGF